MEENIGMDESSNEDSHTISDIPQEDIDEINKEEPEDELNIENLESLKVERKPNIYQNDQPYNFKGKERIDVFIKNYLMKFNMEKSLKIFEQEFYEKLSKNEVDLEKMGTVPDVYIESEKIQKEIGNLQKDLDAAKIYADKANSLFLKLQKAKENEKIRHRRVQQEKQKLIKLIDKMKKVYENDNAIYKTLFKKYRDVTDKAAIFDTQLVSMKQKIQNLVDQEDKLKKTLEESRKTQERINELKDKALIKEELKGNKIIKWTKFPEIPKQIPSYGNFQSANNRMNIFKNFHGHLAGVTSIDFNPKKQIIATASDDKTWKLWKFPTADLLLHGEGDKDWISSINFHPYGKLFATCGGDSVIKIWDLLQLKCIHKIRDHADPVWKTRFHYDGNFMLSASMDKTVRLYDLNNYNARMSYRVHLDSVNSINWFYYSTQFVSGSADKTVTLWDMRTNVSIHTFYDHQNCVNCVMPNVRGDTLASCDSDGTVKFFDLRMNKLKESFDECKQSANCLCFDRSGNICAVGYDDANIRVFEVDKKANNIYKGHEDSVLDLMYDPTNQFLLSCSADRTFKIWQ